MSSSKKAAVKRVTRTKAIYITLPRPDSHAWINFTLQHLYLDEDNEPVQLVDDVDRISKRVDKVATEHVCYIDPITNQEKTMFVAEIAAAVKAAVIKWATESGEREYNAELDQITDVVSE